ncbi:hypothetical protein HNO89_003700 [Sporosarcina luteola]|nr:hypothetical protein [Sporosarcina luteola]
MTKHVFKLMLLSCLLISLSGCAAEEKNNETTSIISSEHLPYLEQIEVARKYIIEKEWGTRTSVKTNTAVVTNHTVNSSDQVLSKKYIGERVYKVSFEDESNVVTGLPVILIEKENNHVIGFIASE